MTGPQTDRFIRIFRLLALSAFAIPWAATGGRAEPQAPPSCAKPSNVQIVQLLNTWRAAFTSGSLDRLSTLYADDAILIATKDGKSYQGRDQIAAYYKDLFARHPNVSIRPSSLEADCGTATVSGTVIYRITGERKGTRMLLGGRYKTEFHQVGDTWRIVRHSLAADPRRIGDPFTTVAEKDPQL